MEIQKNCSGKVGKVGKLRVDFAKFVKFVKRFFIKKCTGDIGDIAKNVNIAMQKFT
jgi:hypothetical protein